MRSHTHSMPSWDPLPDIAGFNLSINKLVIGPECPCNLHKTAASSSRNTFKVWSWLPVTILPPSESRQLMDCWCALTECSFWQFNSSSSYELSGWQAGVMIIKWEIKEYNYKYLMTRFYHRTNWPGSYMCSSISTREIPVYNTTLIPWLKLI